MKTIGIDTNVLVTLKLERKPGFDSAKALLLKCVEGKIKLFIPTPVFLETEWIFRSYYKYPKEKIIEFFEELLIIDTVIVDSKNELKTALYLYSQTNSISFTDYVIMQTIKNNSDDLFTFDEAMKKAYKNL